MQARVLARLKDTSDHALVGPSAKGNEVPMHRNPDTTLRTARPYGNGPVIKALSTRHARKRMFSLTMFAIGLAVSVIQLNAQTFQSNRTLEVKNSCDFEVRVGVNGAEMLMEGTSGACSTDIPCPNGGTCDLSSNLCYGGGISCTADPDCPSGGRCYTPSGNTGGQCYFDIPELSGLMLAEGTSKTVVISNTPLTQTLSTGQTQTLKWSGNIYGGTNCKGSGKDATCETAVCGPYADVQGVACFSGEGPGGPVTLAEFTLVPDNVDSYDISLINGVNVPMSMEATGAIPSNPSDDYWCGAPGGVAGTKVLNGCSWAFETEDNEVANGQTEPVDYGKFLRMVTPTTLNPTSACPEGQVEGSAWDASTATIHIACGTQIGWWTADEYCTVPNRPKGDPFNCLTEANLPSGAPATHQDFYGCVNNVSTSCYQQGATDDCCGAPQWTNILKSETTNEEAEYYATNSQWTQIARPWAKFVKLACPTAYSFPFDDVTSTFQCNSTMSTGSENRMAYKITFCPEGKSGF